jgi:transposase
VRVAVWFFEIRSPCGCYQKGSHLRERAHKLSNRSVERILEQLDYHVEVQGHYYSVPSRMIRQVAEVRATEATIEVFHRGTRIASHARSGVKRRHTTIPEHMPSAHRRYGKQVLLTFRSRAGDQCVDVKAPTSPKRYF